MSSSAITFLTTAHTYLYRYPGIFLYVVGNIGNALTFCVFLRKSWRKNVCVFYFCVCLISNTIFINSTVIGNIFINGFKINILTSNVVLCKLYYYVYFTFLYYFPIVLLLASVDRLLISSQNVDTRLYSSRRLAYLLIGVSAFVCGTFLCHMLIKTNIQQIYPTVFVCTFDLSRAYLDFVSYSSLIVIVFIFVFMIILSVLAFKNVRRIRAIPRQQRQQIRSMTKKDFQLIRCLYIHNITFIVFSIVLVAGTIYSSIMRYQSQTVLEQAVSTFLTNVGSFLFDIPYCTSFFIFVSVSKAFRNELKRFYYRICGKDIRTIREEENNPQETAKNNFPIEENNVVISTIVLPA